MDGAPVAPVVPICVPPSGSVGRDPTDGADLEGAAPAHGVTAMAGSRIAGSARHSTTGTTTGGRLELATPHNFGQPYNRVGPRVRLADKFPRHCDCFCEFRLGRDRPLFLFSSFPIVANANDQEKGAGHNPKGVVADDRNFDKDANDRKNCDQESGDKSKVHLHPLGAWPVCSAHPYIYHSNCRPRDCAPASNALGPGPKFARSGSPGSARSKFLRELRLPVSWATNSAKMLRSSFAVQSSDQRNKDGTSSYRSPRACLEVKTQADDSELVGRGDVIDHAAADLPVIVQYKPHGRAMATSS
jgi:hypothetical protein